MQPARSKNSTSYRDILKEKLAERLHANPRYSLRAFARDLGISAPRLSSILNGRFGLSRSAATQISKKLGFGKEETERFCDQVESEHGRSLTQKNLARERIEKASDSFSSLTLDHFKVISDWYYYAIMELSCTEDFRADIAWISKRLQISVYEAEAAINRLIRLDLLERTESGLKVTGNYFVNPAGIPSDAIKKFHRQILEKAQTALIEQGIEEREFRAITVAIDPKDLPKAKDKIKKFTNDLDREFSQGKQKKEVYQLAIQLFSLTKNEG